MIISPIKQTTCPLFLSLVPKLCLGTQFREVAIGIHGQTSETEFPQCACPNRVLGTRCEPQRVRHLLSYPTPRLGRLPDAAHRLKQGNQAVSGLRLSVVNRSSKHRASASKRISIGPIPNVIEGKEHKRSPGKRYVQLT
jgi:hypothetical protein